jgi:hypothetical protein
MSFIEAIAASPADADLIVYVTGPNAFAVVMRRSDGICNVIAQGDMFAFNLICLGAGEARKALWSYDLRKFITGSVEQLLRNEEEDQ